MLTSPPAAAAPTPWLVIIDPQAIFASPAASAWGSPMWAETVGRISALAEQFTRAGHGVVVTRYVADPNLGGSWTAYFRDWPFALVGDEDPLYAVVPELRPFAQHVVTAPTFGKWNADLRAIIGEQPEMTLAGVSTDCCVLSTALPAADAGARVTVRADCCAGSTPENHQRALDAMALFAPQITIT